MTRAGGILLSIAGAALLTFSLLNLSIIYAALAGGIILSLIGGATVALSYLRIEMQDETEQLTVDSEPPQPEEQANVTTSPAESEEDRAETVTVSETIDEPNAGEEPTPDREKEVELEPVKTKEENEAEKQVPSRRIPRIKGYIYYQGSGEYVPLYKEPIKVEFSPIGPAAQSMTQNAAPVASRKHSPTVETTDSDPTNRSAGQKTFSDLSGREKARETVDGDNKVAMGTTKYWSFPIDPGVDPKEIDLASIPGPDEKDQHRPPFAIGRPEDDLVGESKTIIRSS